MSDDAPNDMDDAVRAQLEADAFVFGTGFAERTDEGEYRRLDPSEVTLETDTDGDTTLRTPFEDPDSEEYATHYAREFVDDLLDEAGHHRTLRLGDWTGVVREMAHTLYEAGFDPRRGTDTPDELAWVFASTEAYHDLVAELAEECRLHGPPYEVDNIYPVYTDPLLPDDTLVMIHRDAIIPAPPANLERPWFVKHPAGVVVAEVLR